MAAPGDLRHAGLAINVRQRDRHLAALSGLLHLLEYCPEGREPRAFVAGHRAFRFPTLRWAAELLDHRCVECTAPDCADPLHVTLLSAPIEASAGIGR
jgi:hypothetical protein